MKRKRGVCRSASTSAGHATASTTVGGATLQTSTVAIADLNDTRIKRQGLSLSGGDPLHPQNVAEIIKLVQRVRAECPGKDIWVWTGYKLDELDEAQMQVVNLINVLVDGKFVQDLKDPALIWRGSSNQVVHHLR